MQFSVPEPLDPKWLDLPIMMPDQDPSIPEIDGICVIFVRSGINGLPVLSQEFIDIGVFGIEIGQHPLVLAHFRECLWLHPALVEIVKRIFDCRFVFLDRVLGISPLDFGLLRRAKLHPENKQSLKRKDRRNYLSLNAEIDPLPSGPGGLLFVDAVVIGVRLRIRAA